MKAPFVITMITLPITSNAVIRVGEDCESIEMIDGVAYVTSDGYVTGYRRWVTCHGEAAKEQAQPTPTAPTPASKRR